MIADYGAATGHNSLLPVSAAIAALRKRTRPEHSVLVTHTDIPDNDFTELFRTLSDDPDSYLKKDTSTFASAVGRSFYSQILPSNSVNLAWSAWSIQWLSRAPMPVPDHLLAAHSHDGRCAPPTSGRPPATGTSSSRSAVASSARADVWWS